MSSSCCGSLLRSTTNFSRHSINCKSFSTLSNTTTTTTKNSFTNNSAKQKQNKTTNKHHLDIDLHQICHFNKRSFCSNKICTTLAPVALLPQHILQSRYQQNDTYTNRNNITTSIGSKRFNSTSQLLRPYVDPKFSYVFGRSNLSLVYKTIGELFDERVKNSPNDLAYIFDAEKKRVTFSELNKDVCKIAKTMVTKFGIKKGDFVGIYAFNCYNWIVVKFACAKVGAVLSPINPAYKASELAHLLEKGKMKLLFTTGNKSVQVELNDHLQVLQSDEIIQLCNEKKSQLANVVLIDRHDQQFDKFKLANVRLHKWDSTLDNDGVFYNSHESAQNSGEPNAVWLDSDSIEPDDLFAVYYTSGTTGKPKGACVSHFTAVNNVRTCQNRLLTAKSKVLLTPLPLFHVFAGVLTSLSTVAGECIVAFPGHKYDLKSMVDSIVKNNVNMISCTPTIIIDMIAYIAKNNIKVPLKIVNSGGAPLLPEIVDRIFNVIPTLEDVRLGYGSTENGAVATLQTIHEPRETRATTVGAPMDFTEIRIVKPHTDQILLLGEAGEIQTRGYNTMVEYLDEPEKTNEVVTKNRWYRTGDIGSMLPHGSIQITGRIKEMIIKGGENIYPKEIEQLIVKLDYVEQVHVIGVPDKRFGEQVCAWIKLKPGYKLLQTKQKESGLTDNNKSVNEADIIEFCKKNITYFKVPKYVLFVDEFPMTPTKKVQHHIMVERSIELLNLHDQL